MWTVVKVAQNVYLSERLMLRLRSLLVQLIDTVKRELNSYFNIVTVAEPPPVHATVRVLEKGASKDEKNGHIDMYSMILDIKCWT